MNMLHALISPLCGDHNREVIAACLAIITALRRLAPHLLRPATLAATYGIGITASFWFLQRLLP